MNCLICVKWGDKYNRNDVEKLKEHAGDNDFLCLTDKPETVYDIPFPITSLDKHYNGNFWAYRKIYMFDPHFIKNITKANKFLFLDLDVEIQDKNVIKQLFDLPNNKPWIVHGYWNNLETIRKNYSTYQSPICNSSGILWTDHQLEIIYLHVLNNIQKIFFTYKTLDNYFAHHWYKYYDIENSLFQGFPKNIFYSWKKGNIFPDDMEINYHRDYCKIKLFNDSGLKNNV